MNQMFEFLKKLYLIGFFIGVCSLQAKETDNSQISSSEKDNAYLISAIQSKQLEKVESILEKRGLDLNFQDYRGWAPIYHAIKSGDWRIVQILIQAGADYKIKDIYGNTPLHLASLLGELKSVQLLLEKGADPNAKSDGGTPLQFAIDNNHFYTVKALHRAGASLEDIDLKHFIFFIIKYGDLKMVEQTIKMGIDVNIRDSKSNTLLHYSALMGFPEIVEFLIKEGANPNTKSDGKTPFQTAIGSEHFKTAKVFFLASARLKSADIKKFAILAVKYEDWKIANQFKQYIDINSKDEKGRTLLHYAIEMGSLEMVQWLSLNGADINIKNDNNQSPFRLAVKKGQMKIAYFLAFKRHFFKLKNEEFINKNSSVFEKEVLEEIEAENNICKSLFKSMP